MNGTLHVVREQLPPVDHSMQIASMHPIGRLDM
jgi:hypothetical protein